VERRDFERSCCNGDMSVLFGNPHILRKQLPFSFSLKFVPLAATSTDVAKRSFVVSDECRMRISRRWSTSEGIEPPYTDRAAARAVDSEGVLVVEAPLCRESLEVVVRPRSMAVSQPVDPNRKELTTFASQPGLAGIAARERW